MARSKVLSVRVTEEEYEAVVAQVGKMFLDVRPDYSRIFAKSPSEVVYKMLEEAMESAVHSLRLNKKKEASLAKRRANAEARKAAAQNDAK